MLCLIDSGKTTIERTIIKFWGISDTNFGGHFGVGIVWICFFLDGYGWPWRLTTKGYNGAWASTIRLRTRSKQSWKFQSIYPSFIEVVTTLLVFMARFDYEPIIKDSNKKMLQWIKNGYDEGLQKICWKLWNTPSSSANDLFENGSYIWHSDSVLVLVD